jgi:tripartite-type tricarboxylate transporter receptor subunit TctC
LIMMMKEEKSAEFPNVPIIKDLGYNIPYPMIMAVIAPKAVPDEIIKKLDDATVKAMKEPAFSKGMKELNLPVVYHSGKELDVYVAKNYEYYSKVLKEMGLTK